MEATWKLSSFVQRAGCAARGPNIVLVVLLVESAAYSILSTQPKKCGKKKQEVASNTDQATATVPQPSEEKDYARGHRLTAAFRELGMPQMICSLHSVTLRSPRTMRANGATFSFKRHHVDTMSFVLFS